MRSQVDERLEYLRGELRAERISYGELSELQDLAKYIDAGDVELLEAAGVPEFDESSEPTATPWTFEVGNDSDNGAYRVFGGEDNSDIVAYVCGDDEPQTKANAALIVSAVNNHALLVEALQELTSAGIEHLEDSACKAGKRFYEALNSAREQLATVAKESGR